MLPRVSPRVTQCFSYSHPGLFVFQSAGILCRLAELGYQLPSNPANQAGGCWTSWTRKKKFKKRRIKGNKNLTPGGAANTKPFVFPALLSRPWSWDWQEILERRTLNYGGWIWQGCCAGSSCEG